MSKLDRVEVELDVLLGRTTMPIKQLLRMGRGAIIELETQEGSDVVISASGATIALGEIAVEDQKMTVRVTNIRSDRIAEVS
jgi:flagellar motor switch protein FliN/FliY